MEEDSEESSGREAGCASSGICPGEAITKPHKSLPLPTPGRSQNQRWDLRKPSRIPWGTLLLPLVSWLTEPNIELDLESRVDSGFS